MMELTSTRINHESTPLNHHSYRADIDGLRAIAVLSVIGFHAFPGKLKGGFIGVDIFFVISGFLITTIIYQNLRNNKFSFIEFYSRRIKRIFPALIFVLTSTALFGWYFLLSNEYEQLGKHLFFGSVFVSNLILWSESGYFDTLAETKPLLHLWSLGVEEQFYIFWPLIVYLLWKIKLNVKATVFIILLSSLFYCIWQTDNTPDAAFYSPQTRFWELLVGSLLSIFVLKTKAINTLVQKNIISCIGLLLIIVGLFTITEESKFPGWLALIPTVGTALIIFSDTTAWVNKKILSNHMLVWFGLISFPLYLWHWPLLSYMRIIEGGKPSIALRICAILTAIILAWLTLTLIEKPIRFKLHNKLTIPFLILSLSAIALFGLSAYLNKGYTNRASLVHISSNQGVIEQMSEWQYKTNDICLKQYLPAEPKSNSWLFCMLNSINAPTILLLGNSYANQVYPGLSQQSYLNNQTILSIGDFDATGYERPKDNENKASATLINRIDHQRILIDSIIQTSPSLKYVIMSGLIENPDDEYIKKIRNRINFIEKNGKIVIVFTPHIKPPFHPKYCFSRPQIKETKNCDFKIEIRENLLKKFQPLIDSISKSNPKVLFFDQTELFCGSMKCSYIKEGLPLHRDESHLSEFGSIKLSELFIDWAQQNIPSIIEKK